MGFSRRGLLVDGLIIPVQPMGLLGERNKKEKEIVVWETEA
jgi:hypothetical protein